MAGVYCWHLDGLVPEAGSPKSQFIAFLDEAGESTYKTADETGTAIKMAEATWLLQIFNAHISPAHTPAAHPKEDHLRFLAKSH